MPELPVEYAYFRRDDVRPAAALLTQLMQNNTTNDDGEPIVLLLEPDVGPPQIGATLSKRERRRAEHAGVPYSGEVLADGNDECGYSLTLTFPDHGLDDWSGPSVSAFGCGGSTEWLKVEKVNAFGSLQTRTSPADVIVLIIEALEHCKKGPLDQWRASTYRV